MASPEYIARWGAPVHPEELKNHRAVVLSWQQAIRLRGPQGEQVQMRAAPGMTCNDGRTLAQLARLGVGIALKSTWDVCESLRARQLLRVLPEWEESGDRFMYALLPGRRYQPMRVKQLLSFLIARLRARVEAADAQLLGLPSWSPDFPAV